MSREQILHELAQVAEAKRKAIVREIEAERVNRLARLQTEAKSWLHEPLNNQPRESEVDE